MIEMCELWNIIQFLREILFSIFVVVVQLYFELISNFEAGVAFDPRTAVSKRADNYQSHPEHQKILHLINLVS